MDVWRGTCASSLGHKERGGEGGHMPWLHGCLLATSVIGSFKGRGEERWEPCCMMVSKFSFWLTKGGFNRTRVARKEAHNWVEWDMSRVQITLYTT
jgi:hypothetical protein